ncbi:Cullin binding-domain-containing protein [Blakeslea trispora]|nr:Cullin binding-domain-containing protein [Blakeslea trispora]
MPPKRKAASNSQVLTAKKPKIPKRKQDTSKPNKATDTQQKWFDQYAEPDNRDIITPDGCQQFFSDLSVNLESTLPLIVGYKMKSNQMGYITKQEFMQTMSSLDVITPEEFKKILYHWEETILNDPSEFKRLYLFSFQYVKSTTQKSMDVETAIALWSILLEPKYPIIKSFIQFIQQMKPVKVINKDQWSSLLDFCKAVPQDLSTYDCTSSWPVLFDDFVEWKNKAL